jgi:hypothetical protein
VCPDAKYFAAESLGKNRLRHLPYSEYVRARPPRDGVVDLIYFTDTEEIFMYRSGKRDLVAQVMPFHRCAVPLDAGMQTTTNRILNREDLSLTEELSITMELITNYLAAKPSIDACNARFEDNSDKADVPPEGFSQFEEDWDAE